MDRKIFFYIIYMDGKIFFYIILFFEGYFYICINDMFICIMCIL